MATRPSGAAAEYTHFAGSSVPAHYGDPAAEHTALMKGAAVVDLSYRPILRLSGKDPVGMLNAVLTNDVPADEGRGVYALLLNPKGRVQAGLRVLKSGEEVLISTEPEGSEAAREILGRYAPFSRVKVDETGWGTLGVYGPLATGLLDGLKLDEHETSMVEVGGTSVLAAGVRHPVPGYDLIGPPDELETANERLVENRASPAGIHAYETLRVESATPRFGSDITPENFPAEAGILERAVSFAKGCYPGQETVARMHYRGHPNRALHRLKIEGAAPPPGTPILQNEKQVGRITSIASLPIGGETIALGYLHRKADVGGELHAGETSLTKLSR
ncbi:folate-binding protein YgfZ [soil metagenome]